MCRLGPAATGRVVTRTEGDFVFWVEGGCMKDEGNGAVEDDGELEVSFLFCISGEEANDTQGQCHCGGNLWLFGAPLTRSPGRRCEHEGPPSLTYLSLDTVRNAHPCKSCPLCRVCLLFVPCLLGFTHARFSFFPPQLGLCGRPVPRFVGFWVFDDGHVLHHRLGLYSHKKRVTRSIHLWVIEVIHLVQLSHHPFCRCPGSSV